jgi:hypothetical protein
LVVLHDPPDTRAEEYLPRRPSSHGRRKHSCSSLQSRN